MHKIIYFFCLLCATVASLFLARFAGMVFNTPQILSISIFSMFIFGTLLFGEFRLAFALGGIALLLGLNLLTIDQFVLSANLKVIIFLVNMFMVIGFLEENRFFEHIVSRIVKTVGPRPNLLILVIMLLATVSAALVDEVTSILFMTGTMLHLTSKYKVNPVPFVIMLVFATNIGSASSSIGNPIGVMIALDAGFSFTEFLRWSAPIALVVNVATYFICRWWFAEAFATFGNAVRREHQRVVGAQAVVAAELALTSAGGSGMADVSDRPMSHTPVVEEFEVTDDDPREIRISWIVFLATILLLVTHGLSEKLLGLHEGTMMVGASLIMGCVVLLLRNTKARELVERRVDWWTLTFFMMLFASVGTLEHTQVTKVIAQKMIAMTGGNHTLMAQTVGWATGWLSAFLDNVLAVATFMPVVHDIRLTAAPDGYPASIYWLMLFGGTFMGNMTIIGSTANIVALGVLEKRGHGTISFWYWMKIGLVVSIVSMIIASAMLELQLYLFGNPILAAPIAGAAH
jgi:Na+/H+ antiporter NhaD/arsenite permease-like protein